jgi:Methyltransferase domain
MKLPAASRRRAKAAMATVRWRVFRRRRINLKLILNLPIESYKMKIRPVIKQLKIKPVVKGLLTFVPGMQMVLPEKGTGGTDSAYYCYGVWLKHLTLLWENGMRSIPDTVAELGPGDSLGIGLASMLCGVKKYYALDVVRHANTGINLKILNELVALFESRAERPAKGWPDIDKYLDDNLFPSHILNDELLKESLSYERIRAIRKALEGQELHNDTAAIDYRVPWWDESIIEKDSVDVIISHSVLEHVVDIENTYEALYSWLKPKGMMTHQIDFTSHGLSETWNGYRVYPEFLWKIITGKRPFSINRQPHSVHTDLMTKNHFNVICNLTRNRADGIQRSALSNYWKTITDNDLACSGAFIQAMKCRTTDD